MKVRMTGGSVFLGLLLLSVTCVWSAPVHIYVSPTGSDSNNGRTREHPVKTLQHAVSMLSQNGIHGNSVFVELMQGYHDLPSTLHIQSTSGTVVFRAYQGQEVHVTGGRRLPSNQFHHVTDQHVLQRLPKAAHGKVLEFDLQAAHIKDLGTLHPFGFTTNWSAPLELFINGNALRLGEFPSSNFINIKATPDGRMGHRFTHSEGSRDVQWAKETEPWVYGYFWASWADYATPVSHFDPHTHTVFLKSPPVYGVRPGHYHADRNNVNVDYHNQGGYFRVYNMLCEVDQPGEYYVDRTHKKLYVWPNTPHQTLTSSDIVYASMLEACIVIGSNAHNVHFEDITLEACRDHGFLLNDARNVVLKNLEIKNTGGNAIHCSGDCRSVSVLASDIYDVCGGVFISGGDRAQLTSSNNVVRDNHIWHHARVGAQPNHAIKIGGVHGIVSHNHLHHGQYTGIWWYGNEHVIEYNHVHHMCFNASDCGAIHSGREWTWRGNVIRNNIIHDVLRHTPGADNRGVMLDDQYSSVVIEHNVFYNNYVHTNIGGGRDNVIRYNIMYNAVKQSIQVDGRGLTRHTHGPSQLQDRLHHSPYRTPLWKTRYPKLYDIDKHNPNAPMGNQIYDNVFYNTPDTIQTVHYSGPGLDHKDYYDVHDNHKALHKTEFVNPEHGDFRLHGEAAQWAAKVHFPKPVTLNEVGPTVATGPNYLRVHRHGHTAVDIQPTVQNHMQPTVQQQHTSHSPSQSGGATVAPAVHIPRVSYLPDGSSPNTLYPHIAKHGCWLITGHCPSHPAAQGTQEDDTGTQSGTEEGCLARAAQQWKWCGSPANGKVFAVYGPTGATTLGGEGCYLADYGCKTPHAGTIHHDSYAEKHEHAADSEAACLRRAQPEWHFCGSPPNSPVTSIYGPTGAKRTAGAGCWIKIPSCPAHPDLEGYFFDAWGETNRHTGTDKDECFKRATDYWKECGSHSNAPVTADFRPAAQSHTVH